MEKMIERILQKGFPKPDSDRFELIIRHYNPLLFRVGMSYLHTREDVEDAMQTTWMKAFEKLKSFKSGAKFSTWLCRILINECLMQLRRGKRHVLLLNENPSDNVDDQVHRMTKQQVISWVEDAVRQLPTEYRSVYMLREVEGKNVEETAAILGISPENVKVRLHRARKFLKQELLSKVPVAELFEYHRKYCDKLTARILTSLGRRL